MLMKGHGVVSPVLFTAFVWVHLALCFGTNQSRKHQLGMSAQKQKELPLKAKILKGKSVKTQISKV